MAATLGGTRASRSEKVGSSIRFLHSLAHLDTVLHIRAASPEADLRVHPLTNSSTAGVVPAKFAGRPVLLLPPSMLSNSSSPSRRSDKIS